MANQAAEEISGGDHIIGCHATFVRVVWAMQGHWKNECPAVGCSFQSDTGYSVGSNNESQGHPPDTNVYGANHIQLMSDDNRSEVYIDVKVRGRTLPALLTRDVRKASVLCASVKMLASRQCVLNYMPQIRHQFLLLVRLVRSLR